MAEALLQAGLVRMRPIMMTTAAMVFGMLPLALALDEGGEIQAPMGRAIIGGVITSTLLTLVVVPVLYSYLVRDRQAAKPAAEPRRRAWRAGGAHAGAHAGIEGLSVRRALRRRALLRDVDDVAHHRVDVVLPALAAEHAVVADAGCT